LSPLSDPCEDFLGMRAAGGGITKKLVAWLTERNRSPFAAPGQRPCRRGAPWVTETEVIAALMRAWLVATISIVLFCGALAVASICDRAIFLEALHEALTTNPEFPQPADDVPVDTHDPALRPSAR
jgi:hypothetical protein